METKERNIYLFGEIDSKTAQETIERILSINCDDSDLENTLKEYEREPIKLYISSIGGSVYNGLAIIDIIEKSKTPIHVIALGGVMSMGVWILLHGHKKFMGANSYLMIHDVGANLGMDKTEGHLQDLSQIISLREKLIEKILSCSLVKEEDMNDIISRKMDWYINFEEAMALKLVDEKYEG